MIHCPFLIRRRPRPGLAACCRAAILAVAIFLLGQAAAVSAPAGMVLEEGTAYGAAPEQSIQDGLSDSEDSVSLPLLGTVETSRLSLPVLTLVIAGLDSFNPCAFFVLFFLLSLLLHAHSRKRMVIIGGIFVLFSGLLYFVFMAAWLNFFLLVGRLKYIAAVAGAVAIVIATINIKDYFFFKRGISLTIPEQAKPRLFERMRNIMRAGSVPAMLAATIFLAFTANLYELICTAGFPMIYTRALTLQPLPMPVYYLYLALYNVVYVIPLAGIVALFAVTLGSRRLSERHGRVLKLLSGVMMFLLGLILLIKPHLLASAVASAAVLVVALVTSWLIVRLAPQNKEET
ncbi:hypothetical protein [Geotalea toluenoxydans]|uniref:hypothetical protein n=1 Tax=Geotalea toluenoxydans TaxID=421624 RepID=UPI0006D2C983|nr:hypothetical protein [Geotalea toluenoxydans]